MLSITMPRQALLVAVQRALKPVLPNPQHEIFKCFHLVASGNVLTVEGSDMSMSVLAQCVFPGPPQDDRLCVPAKQFHDVLSKFTQDQVTLAQQDGGLLLTCGRAKAVLNVVKADQWPPELDEASGSPVLEISASKLKQALNKVLWAGKEESDQPKTKDMMLTGSDLSSMITMGATDSKTLAMTTVAVDHAKAMSIMLPIKFAKKIEQVLEDDTVTTSFVLHQGRLHVTVGTTRLWMPLSVEPVPQYPSLDRILGDSPWVGKVSKPALVASLELVKAGSGKGEGILHTTTLTADGHDSLILTSGQAEDSCPCDANKVVGLQIATDDLLAALKAAPGNEIILSKGPGPLSIGAVADPLWTAFITPRSA